MSDSSIRESIEFDDATPLAEWANEHEDDAIDSDNQTDDGSDHTPSPNNNHEDPFGEDFDHRDSSSASAPPQDGNTESSPAESESDSSSPKTSRLAQLFTNFADEFLDIVEEDAQEAVIAAAKAQNTDLGKMVKEHDRDIANLTDHVLNQDKRTKAESEKVRGEMKSLKRSIKNRDSDHSAFQDEVSDRFATLEQSVVDRILLLEKITSSRMTRLEKSINARFASLEKSMNDRFAELEERID